MGLGNTRWYIEFKRRLIQERGARCEACGAAATHPHHIIPISETSICSELAYEPANVLILCDDCHCLMHPGYRSYPWLAMRQDRRRSLLR
jgi:5-methylcytosine-specific restriction endonuclease McrA